MSVMEHPATLSFGDDGALRETIGASGRLHLDRWLPFIVVHRGDATTRSLARRVATNSPAYLTWSPDDDGAALTLLGQVVGEVRERLDAVPLIVVLADQPVPQESRKAPQLPKFVARIAADSGASVDRAADRLEKAVAQISADLRPCKVERIAAERALIEGVPSITLHLPAIHIRPDGEIYPQLEHDLSVAFGDALLQAACAYLDDGQHDAPVHYRSLGRRAFLAAARAADRKLGTVGRSFDFLLSV